MTRYRWAMPARKGRWLPTKEAAQDAAIKAGLASRQHSGQFVAGVFLEIEECYPLPPR